MSLARKTRTPSRTIPTLPAIRPNAGIRAWYQKRLDAQIKALHDSLAYWLAAEYKALGIAKDESPAIALRQRLRKLARRWQKVFDELADTLSKRMVDQVLSYGDKNLASALKAKGIESSFNMTPTMNDAYQAVIGENVGLIRSIAREHLTEVEGLVMRSVARGRDLAYLCNELRARYGVTKRRAALIARDQNNKATAVMQAARQKELGMTEGIWRHSHAGKHPRPSHVAADGKRFLLDKGLYLEGQWILPGEAINCRCTWSPVIPGLEN